MGRFEPPLRAAEVTRGVRALSSLYVERRSSSNLSARAGDGLAKRAAFATYYAPLHFLAAHYAMEDTASEKLRVRRVVDLGSGTGAAGAAVASSLAAPARVLAIDRLGWALSEARHTLRAFGLRGSTTRRGLPQGLPGIGSGDLVVCGWLLNELDELERTKLLVKLTRARDRGAHLLLLEPLARGIAPWWDQAVRELQGSIAGEIKRSVERPKRIEALDTAAGLDHREISARYCLAAGSPRGVQEPSPSAST